MRRKTCVVFAVTALQMWFLVADVAAQEARIRDSAGVRIVENPARKEAPVRFSIGDKPLLVVGGRELNRGDEFEHNQGYLRGVQLSNGGLAVIDVSRVHFFDPIGRRTRIVGRGQGPQGFEYLTSICRTRGDTLILNDRGYLSVLDASGTILLTVPRGNVGNAPFSFCLDDGTFVLEQVMGEVASGPNRITRLRTDGTIVNEVGTFPRPPFDLVTMVTPTVVASGNAVYYAEPFTGEVRVFNSSGTLRRIVRTADRGDSITVEDAEQRMSNTIPRNVTPAEYKERMDRMRARPYARNWPVLLRMEVGSDGTIWVQDFYKAPRTADAWTAIDSTGRIVGRLVIPPAQENMIRLDVISFGRDNVMVRRFDANRLTSLAVLPLLRVDRR